MMKKILITSFEPFGGLNINASLEIMKNFNYAREFATIEKLVLPTVFNDVEQLITRKIDSFNPNIILLLGEAGGTEHIRLERVAINIDDARIKDNKGQQPIDHIIKDDGDSAYFASLPIKSIYDHLSKESIPVVISNSAGTFVCNHLMYLTLHYLKQKKASNIIAGFIHFPYIESQITNEQTNFLSLDTSTKALKIMIDSLL